MESNFVHFVDVTCHLVTKQTLEEQGSMVNDLIIKMLDVMSHTAETTQYRFKTGLFIPHYHDYAMTLNTSLCWER